ncbi:hypothetical protein OROMI_029013 [Orobanche minor]
MCAAAHRTGDFQCNTILSVPRHRPVMAYIPEMTLQNLYVLNWQLDSEVTNPKFEFYHEEIRSIGVDHPIVSVVGNFAVAAFNKACKKHVKKVGEHYHFHMS